MKVQFIATGTGPDQYHFAGETINGFDLSPLEFGGQFLGNDGSKAAGIRAAYRDADGELHVTLKQPVVASQLPGKKAHWRGTGIEIDPEDYDPSVCYVTPTGVAHLTEGVDYVLAWSVDVAGQKGWTVRAAQTQGGGTQ